MRYRKNLFAWEQMARIVAGIAMIAGGLIYLLAGPGCDAAGRWCASISSAD